MDIREREKIPKDKNKRKYVVEMMSSVKHEKESMKMGKTLSIQEV